MPRIALVQDGTEVARQRYADVLERFLRCREQLSSTRGLDFSLEPFTDDRVRFLLSGISPEEFDCIVFASNALLSDGVMRSVARHRGELRRYVRSGGGLLVLHQVRPSLDDVLPADVCPRLVDRSSRPGVEVRADAPDDVTLRYPESVALDRLAERQDGSGPSRLYWKAFGRDSMPQKLRPVLSAGDGGSEVLLARTVSGIPERVVVATVPLDWHGSIELLVNAIRYVSLGEPRRLLWLPEGAENERTDLFLRWLYSDGASAVTSMPGPDTMSEPEQWLFDQVDVCIVPPRQFDAVRNWPEIVAFVARGGTLITAEPVDKVGASEVSALIGGYSQRVLARRLYAELAANPAWVSFDNAFHLRNVVSALDLFRRKGMDDTVLAVRPDDIRHLADPIRRRLGQEDHRDDLSSSLALGEILCHLVPEPRGDASLFAWMDQRGPSVEEDVRLQIRALRSRWLCQPDPDFLQQACRLLVERSSPQGPPPSFAPVVRLMDAFTMLDDAGLLVADEASIEAFAEALNAELRQRQLEPDVGWISVEATADITRGLVALIGRLPRSDAQNALAAHLAAGATVLRRAMPRYDDREPSRAWLAQLARLIHALVVVDERFPIGLQRLASLEWPDDGPARDLGSGAEDSLMVDLAVQVKDLRATEQDLREQLRVKEQDVREQRWAAATGRAFATVLGTALVAVPFAVFLWLFTPDSAWDWIANVGILLPVFAVALGLMFVLLKRGRLLTALADRSLELLGELSGVLAKIGSIKRRSPDQ
jgi:hypothetical protein